MHNPKLTKAKVEDLWKKLAEMSKSFEVAEAKQEISEWTSSRLQKNVEELRESKERCYERSLDCAKKLKDNFCEGGCILIGAKVYSRRSRRSR
jgi:hypothetical protein